MRRLEPEKDHVVAGTELATPAASQDLAGILSIGRVSGDGCDRRVGVKRGASRRSPDPVGDRSSDIEDHLPGRGSRVALIIGGADGSIRWCGMRTICTTCTNLGAIIRTMWCVIMVRIWYFAHHLVRTWCARLATASCTFGFGQKLVSRSFESSGIAFGLRPVEAPVAILVGF